MAFGYVATLATAQADGAALASAATASLLPTSALALVPPPMFIGKKLRISAAGRISNTTTPGTITFLVKAGATTVFTSGAITMSATAHTNVTWELLINLTCRAAGNGTIATFMGTGRWTTEANLGTAIAGVAYNAMLPVSAPVVGTGVDGTVSQLFDLQATLSAASQSIQLHEYSLESMQE